MGLEHIFIYLWLIAKFCCQMVVPKFYYMMRQLCEIRAALLGVSNEAFEQQQVSPKPNS